MALLPAKCPECGGFVEVDSEKRLGVCQHCGQPFVVEEAIQTFNTYYNITNNYNTTNNYSDGAVVNIFEDKSKDFVIEGGVLKKYQGASIDVVIPDGVVEIGHSCFRGLRIKSISIPDSVTRIGYSAFAYCENLESVIIPHGVTRIDDWAFASCISLNDVTIPDSVTMIGDCAFSFCDNLNSVTIPRNLSYMGSSVFGHTPYENIQKAQAEAEKAAERRRIIAERKSKGLCKYCGGKFKGLFNKQCVGCGSFKDLQ